MLFKHYDFEIVVDTDGTNPSRLLGLQGPQSTMSSPGISDARRSGTIIPNNCPRSLSPDTGKWKDNSSSCGWDGQYSTSDTCDPAKSSGAGWVGTAVVREYRIRRGKRGRGGMVCGLGKEAGLERSVS